MAYSIVVLIKQVPDMNAVRVNQSSGELQFSGQMMISSFDDYAIEEALRLKEAHGGEVGNQRGNARGQGRALPGFGDGCGQGNTGHCGQSRDS